MASAAPPSTKATTSTEPATPQQQPAQQSKKGRGVVKSVLSGDTLVVLEDTQGKVTEKIITLSSLSAPRLARGDGKEDELFAWESREFLRKKVVGKKIQFSVDHTTPNRDYVTVYLAPAQPGGEPECLNHTVVSEGWASIQNKDSKRTEALVALEEAAVLAGKGKHSKDKPKPISKNDEDADVLLRQLKGKPVQAIVEQVRTGTAIRVTILPSRHNIQIFLSGAQANSFGAKKNDKVEGKDDKEEREYLAFAEEAKHFVESHVLQREVTLTVDGIAPGNTTDKQVSFSGSIDYKAHDVAEELLKEGLAKYVPFSAASRGTEWVAKLKAAEQSAKDAKRRIHSKYTASKSVNTDSYVAKEKEFTAKVVNVINSGSFMVVPEGTTTEVQINLSTIKAPWGGSKEEDANSRAERFWAAEGKELLRKRLIGQKVRVVYDYTTQPKKKENEQKDPPSKPFCTVYQNDQNIAVILVESGYATVMTFGRGDAERSVDYEVLVMAEGKAKAAHKGLHSSPDKVPVRRVIDLCVDNNADNKKRAEQITRAKSSLQTFERAGPMKAIVDYVFSGARFKVTVPKQSTVFIFALSGLKVPRKGDGEADSEEISNNALSFAKDKLHQLEVTVEVNGVDQGGNFNGHLLLGKKNFSLALLENGFAKLHYPSAERLKEYKEFSAAEEAAKAKRIGVWKSYDPEAEKAKAEAEAAATGEVLVGTGKVHEFIVTEVIDGSRLFIQQVSAESAGLDELVNQLTELSVSEGGGLPLLTPRVGEYVRAQFSQDDKWYRAKVLEVSAGKYKLLYVDYGNSEVVPQARIRTLPVEFNTTKLPDQAQRAAIAFLKPLKEDNDNSGDARELLKEIAAGRKLNGTIEYKDANGIYVTLTDPADGDLNVAVEMVRNGLARIERRGARRHQSNTTYQAIKEAEEEAKRRRMGIWYYGHAADSDEDEKELPKKAAAAAPRKK